MHVSIFQEQFSDLSGTDLSTLQEQPTDLSGTAKTRES